jgi:hypothetical protein
MFFLEFRITSLLQSISILLLSDSVSLIGQSLVLHNCVIIDNKVLQSCHVRSFPSSHFVRCRALGDYTFNELLVIEFVQLKPLSIQI